MSSVLPSERIREAGSEGKTPDNSLEEISVHYPQICLLPSTTLLTALSPTVPGAARGRDTHFCCRSAVPSTPEGN